jgi:hypothetical protein
MENNFSALKSIQELKNLLDSGAITQQEYEVLKQKIIFGNNTPTAAPAPSAQPVTTAKPVVPPQAPAPANPHTVEGNPLTPEYRRVNHVNPEPTPASPALDKAENNEYFTSDTINQPEELTQVKKKDWLLTILISLAAILLIGLVAYQLFSESDSERLTSKSGPEAEEEAIREEAPAATETSPAAIVTEPAPAEKAEKAEEVPQVTNTPAVTPAPEASTTPTTENPVVTETTPPAAAPKLTEEEAINKIKDRLQAYYADMKSAPFSAQSHFAPSVERYYTLTGTTPQAINENINTYHFNEFQDSQSDIEDGSLKLTSSGDSGYEVTYIEHGTAFRKSKGQKQETTARVRARFDKDFKLTYFRQEQLLENKFID